MANSCMENDVEEIWGHSATTFCFILHYFIWKPWSVNLVFMFEKNPSAMEALRLCSRHTLCLEVLSFSHTFSVFFFPCLRTLVIENPGVLLQACGLLPPYFICIMRHRWLNFKCTPWLVLPQYVINVCFSLGFLIFCRCFVPSHGVQIGRIRLYACFKAQGVLFIGKKYINAPAKSLEDLSSSLSLSLSQLPHCITWAVIVEVQMCVVGQCSISVSRSGVCFHPCTLATVLPPCPRCDMASSVVTAFIIQPSQ